MSTLSETQSFSGPGITAVDKVKAMIHELDGLLRAQRAMLQQRGMNLPPGTLQDVATAGSDLDKLAAHLRAQQIELTRLRALADTSALINSALGLDEVLNRVMDTVIRLTDAERGYIVLRDEQSGAMTVRVARNLDRETIERGSFTVSRSVVNSVAQTGTPVVTTNAQSDPRFADQESVVSYSLRSILCVPLKIKETVIGVVYADNHVRSGLFGESELALLIAFADQAAVAIENARLFENVRATLEEVTENKELLESVFASLASAVITTDRSGNIIIWNQAAERIFGLERQEVMSAPLASVLPFLGSDFYVALDRVLREGAPYSAELEPVLPARGKAVLAVRLSPLKTHDQSINGATILVDDLTDIRRREATLAEVRRYLPPAMVENIRAIDTLALGGEEREISVIFADVRGFTGFSEQLEPEELMAIINRYLEVASDAIHLYEGIIDKYMGDAVVGLYNTQLNPQEDDHALRAIRAAMSMVYDVKALHDLMPPGARLWYGIGIDTGLAVLGNVGSEERKEFTALGHPVAHAKQLQEAAERGEIIISEATYQRVRDRIDVEPVQRPFRSDARPHTVYRVLGFKRRGGAAAPAE